MSGVANLLIFGILVGVERYGQGRAGTARTWPFNGFLFTLYVGLFCLERFSMEWLRADAVPLLGSLSWAHLATLGGMAAALAVMAAACGGRGAQKHRNARRAACPVFCHGERWRKAVSGLKQEFHRGAWAAMARW